MRRSKVALHKQHTRKEQIAVERAERDLMDDRWCGITGKNPNISRDSPYGIKRKEVV